MNNGRANWMLAELGRGRVAREIDEALGGRRVNPPVDGRRTLSYAEYLGLGDLLGAQVPATTVPDERAFITTHQQIEIVFRQMLFDLQVISRTFEELAVLGFDACKRLSLIEDELDDPTPESDFWRPARTAAARLMMSATVLLPAEIAMLGPEGSPCFSTAEFANFRAALEPASGFQSGQFRLIERAFGKRRLLGLPIFPRDVYRRAYGSARGDEGALGPVVDETVYGRERRGGLPEEPALEIAVCSLEEAACAVLARFEPPRRAGVSPPQIRLITDHEVAEAIAALERILGHHAGADHGDAVARFAASIADAAREENGERRTLAAARRGCYALKTVAPGCALVVILDALVATDDALFSARAGSFVTAHQSMATSRIRALTKAASAREADTTPPSGTGGGGPAYLAFRRKYLLPLFPALVAVRDIEDAEALSWVE